MKLKLNNILSLSVKEIYIILYIIEYIIYI